MLPALPALPAALLFLCSIYADYGMEAALQFGQKQRLAAKSRNPSFLRLIFNLRPIVCRKHDNRYVFSHFFSDPAGHLHAIHIRQQPVNHVHTVLIAAHHRLPGAEHRFLPGQCPLRTQPNLLEHIGDAVASVKIIIHHQRPAALKLRDI